MSAVALASAAPGQSPRETLVNDIKEIPRQFWEGTPWAQRQLERFQPRIATLGEDNARREVRVATILDIQKVIETDYDELLRKMGLLARTYLERFKVKSDTADAFKIAYFFGVALGSEVKALRPAGTHERVVMLTTVELLDIFCNTHCGHRMPSDMRHKLDMSIAEDKYREEFGTYGIYHSFKTLAKICD